MEEILQWGLDCVRQVQTLAVIPGLTIFMRAVTHIGSTAVYIFFFPFMYLCVDEKKGMRLAMVLFISTWINLALKFFFNQPRPFFEVYDPSVGIIVEIMGGFPSGHAQNSLVILTMLASWKIIPGISRAAHFGIAVFLCLVIGFSRIYLGVHFPTDVFGGWLLGGLVLAVYYWAGARIEAWFETHNPRIGLTAAAVLAFAMNMYRPSEYLLMPSGMILGLGIGWFLCRRYIEFNASIKNRTGMEKRLSLLIRYVLGITAMALLYVAAGKVINGLRDSGNYHLYVFIRNVLMAVWISAGAPWVFRKLRLA